MPAAVALAEPETARPTRRVPEPASSFQYQPALDGLRALAVLGVLLYHAGVSWAPGGFLGVDAFFVLSGFLITSLLVDEWRKRGRIDFRAFWARRARRLLPALVLVVVAVGAYALFVARPDELERIRGDTFGSLLYVANWRQLFESSYFAQLSTPSPLRHTWSLGIEEQWYLVWPLALVLVLRVTAGRRWAVIGVIAALAIGSAVLMAALFDRSVTRVLRHRHARPGPGHWRGARASPRASAAAFAAATAATGERRRESHRARVCRDPRRRVPGLALDARRGHLDVVVHGRFPGRGTGGRGADRGGDSAVLADPRAGVLARAPPSHRVDLVRPVLVAVARLRVPDAGADRPRRRRAARRPACGHLRPRADLVPSGRAAHPSPHHEPAAQP